ncbi:glycoside hydrolase family 25 protein [Saccharopolyspora pogona]|uniref:glycoside hydrolase family 25 protein n=2 Tax=Saccharopolyspora pogona TaxID=333966 RepID=UPI0016849A27|nr:glycoside hydrolase family 25 protein [Saccharopolyspora pogona]
MIWGIDISRYQAGIDLDKARAEGFDFVLIKATQGSSWVDPQFARNLAAARAAGLLHAAYHYQEGSVSAAAQADHIARVVPQDCPVILDVEKGGGPAALTRDLTQRLRDKGYLLPLLYLPEWYWRELGRPSLAGLPPLWYSRYPSNRAGSASEVYARNQTWLDGLWGGYGGLSVAVLQFTDQGRVAGRSPVDCNAFRGTREQLAALLGGSGGASGAVSAQEEDDLTPEQDERLKRIEKELVGSWDANGVPKGWGTDIGPRTVVAMLVDLVNALLGEQLSTYPNSKIKLSAVRAIRDNNGLLFQLPAMINAAGQADPAKVAAALRPVLADVVGPVVAESVRAALGEDNQAQADAIVTELAQRLAGGVAA